MVSYVLLLAVGAVAAATSGHAEAVSRGKTNHNDGDSCDGIEECSSLMQLTADDAEHSPKAYHRQQDSAAGAYFEDSGTGKGKASKKPKKPSPPPPPPPPPPPFNCTMAEPQAGRNVTEGYKGGLMAKYMPYENADVEHFIQTNLHWHCGAEHFSLGQYDKEPEKLECKAPAGYECPVQGDQTPYDFKYCEDCHVGDTYEFHWVYSTGAPLPADHPMSDEDETNLYDFPNQIFARVANANAIVRGRICTIFNDKGKTAKDYAHSNFLYNWNATRFSGGVTNGVRYLGSTTGSSVNNEVCSNIEASWHVDRECCKLSAQELDATCKQMKAMGLTDNKPKGSRVLVAFEWASMNDFPLYEPNPKEFDP